MSRHSRGGVLMVLLCSEANAKEEERLRKLAERDGKSVEERLEIIVQSAI